MLITFTSVFTFKAVVVVVVVVCVCVCVCVREREIERERERESVCLSVCLSLSLCVLKAALEECLCIPSTFKGKTSEFCPALAGHNDNEMIFQNNKYQLMCPTKSYL